jgi:uncharacterized protein (DUF362 family)/NAD-dependent dihydropyrimidine dehydrogenase PreA subunit
MSSHVAIVRCEDYEKEKVYRAVGEGIALLGGVEKFCGCGETILIKPNLLRSAAPEKAVTTHPAVVSAVARHFLEADVRVSLGDSPGFGKPESVAKKSGLGQVLEEHGIAMADFQTAVQISFPEGHLIRQFMLAQGVVDADGIVSLPKFKTHALTRITGAVKNQFGCIPGLLKGEFHARLPEMDRFARMLADLCRAVNPRLYIMDAVVAMEGNGPGNGDPRALNAILLSEDPVALDAAACAMIDLDPALVPTCRWGAETGLGSYAEISYAGSEPAAFHLPDFKVNRKEAKDGVMNRVLARLIRQLITPRPVIAEENCTRCGTCVRVCPATPKAVQFENEDRNKPPVYNYTDCIRCYCCQELCPEKAIHVATPLPGRVLGR